MSAEQTSNPLLTLPIIPYLIIFAIFYFMIIKPQKDTQTERKNLLSNLQKNDEVVTSSGIHGTVVLVKDKTVVVRVDDNVKIEFDKDSITTVTKAKT